MNVIVGISINASNIHPSIYIFYGFNSNYKFICLSLNQPLEILPT